jgi:mono/diheme cytochrome c family protein
MRVVAGITMLVVAVTLWWTPGVAAADEFTPTEDPVAGARLFQTKGCVRCHAINGVGGTAGPALGQITKPGSFYDLAAEMWNHLPQMATRLWSSSPLPAEKPYMTPNEMSDLIAFLYKPRAFGERLPGEPGDPRSGERLVADKGCLGCHSLEAPPRGKVGGSLSGLKGLDSPWTIIAKMWNHGFLMASTIEGSNAWPRVTSREMADLVAFLRAHGFAGR